MATTFVQLPTGGYAELPSIEPSRARHGDAAPDHADERVTVRLPRGLKARLAARAASDGMPLETWLALALDRSAGAARSG